MHTPSIKVAEDWLIRKCVILRGKEKGGGRVMEVGGKQEVDLRKRRPTENIFTD